MIWAQYDSPGEIEVYFLTSRVYNLYMLTLNEAVERARKIWGPKFRVVSDIPRGSWRVDVGRKTHRLDINGHANCHDECKKAEIRNCQ
jgi:hypothetical protein